MTQIKRDTTFATPGYSVFAIIPRWGRKLKFFLSVVNPAVKAVFWPVFTTFQNPANARAARLSGLRLLPSWMVMGTLPNQVRYQLRYTRIFESIIAKKLRKVKNYELAKLWSKNAILTTIRKSGRCIHFAATARFSDDIKIILLGKFPNQARYHLRYTRIPFLFYRFSLQSQGDYRKAAGEGIGRGPCFPLLAKNRALFIKQ